MTAKQIRGRQAPDGSEYVTLTDGDGNLGSVSITGTVTIDTTGLSTSAKQDTQITAEQAILATAGATSGAAVVTDANGTIQQYLRGIVKLLITAGTVVLGAGSAIIGKVGIDQTTPGTTNAVAPISGQAGVAGGAGAVSALTQRTTLASDDPAVATLGATGDAAATQGSTGSISAKLRTITSQLNTLHTDVTNVNAGEYETVAAGQTAQALGATGATGDYLEAVLIVPATVNPGNVIILDNAISITIFTGGTASVSDLAPIYVPLAIISVSGAWKITTGSNVSAIGIGNFT